MQLCLHKNITFCKYIALIDQITTVSKMRIYDPRNARGVLSGIRLSPDALDKINEKLKELFIF